MGPGLILLPIVLLLTVFCDILPHVLSAFWGIMPGRVIVRLCASPCSSQSPCLSKTPPLRLLPCFPGGWTASLPHWHLSSLPALSSTSTAVPTVSFRQSRWSASWPSRGSEGGGCTPGAWTPLLTWSTSARFLTTMQPDCCTFCTSACQIWHKIKGQALAHMWRRGELAGCWLDCVALELTVPLSTYSTLLLSLSIVHL